MAKNSPYPKAFLDEIKSKLEEDKKSLEKELAKFTKPNPNVEGDFNASFPEYGDEDDDNAREVAQYTANKPLEITLEKSLRDVNKALDRLGNGSYGICKYCDEPIGEERLRARPTSGACVSCKKTLTNES